jgi:hypothetical protein
MSEDTPDDAPRTAKSNAERQRAHRQRFQMFRDLLKASLPRAYFPEADWLGSPRGGLDTVLYVLRELVRGRHAKLKAERIDEHGLRFEVSAPIPESPQIAAWWDGNIYAYLVSRAFSAWAGKAATRLWSDGEPVRFRVTIEPVVNKRKLKAAEKAIAEEEAEGQALRTQHVT